MMNNKIVPVVVVVVTVLASVGIVYVIQQEEVPTPNTFGVWDARDRIVQVPNEIDSILAIGPCSLQIVSFFDAVNKVKFLDGSSNGEKLSDFNRTHSFILKDLLDGLPMVDWNDAEQVVMAAPDLIISSMVSKSDLDAFQKRVGIPVFAINADVEFGSREMGLQIGSLGIAFGEVERANELNNGILDKLNYIRNKSEVIDGLTAYACGMMYYGAGNFLKTSGDYYPFYYAKVENVYPPAVNGQPYNTDLETLISKNPSMIFIDGSSLASVKAYIASNKGLLSSVDAISEGKVYKTMIYKNWGTNWVNQIINVYFVADVLHPGEFGNIEDNANEIIQLFYPGTSVTYAMLAGAQTGGGCGTVAI